MGEALITRRGGGGGKFDYFTWELSSKIDPRKPVVIPDGFNNKGACDNILVWGRFKYDSVPSTLGSVGYFFGDAVEIRGNEKTFGVTSDGTNVTIDLSNCFSSSSFYRYAGRWDLILIKEV